MKSRAVLVFLILLPATAARAAHHDPATVALTQLHNACARLSMTCTEGDEIVREIFGGLERAGGGVSYDDERDSFDAATIDVEVGSYYFAPRVLQVNPGQTVRFVNTSPVGGTRHWVNSSDWGSPASAAFPVPGPLSFGGGAGGDLSSGVLQPGGTWTWTMPTGPSDHPETGIRLGIDKVLLPYHCNLHGSSTMNGYLILSTANY